MRRIALLSTLLAAFAVLAYAVPANAQATRTWVSGVGDDANPCSRTAPCKTFAGAISKTAPGGEINVLDPGGFGAVTITKSITIRSDHVEAGVLVSGTNGIVIQAGATDTVTLEGLDIEGLGTGLNGVRVLAGLKVYINRCMIHHFSSGTGFGVDVQSATNGSHVFIDNSYIIGNLGGVNVATAGATVNVVSITNTQILSNTSFAVQANGTNAIIGVQQSILNDSPAGISKLNGGQVISVGTSNLLQGTGTFSSSIAFQ